MDQGKVIAATAGRPLHTRIWAPLRGVAVPNGPVLKELLVFNERVVACFPSYSGVTHHEVVVTLQGPVHCEIAARAGGTGVAPPSQFLDAPDQVGVGGRVQLMTEAA
ncbi:hypothetical protein [Actinomadura sp. SCN-SB]|uniref:hypothetical protein n=1 Tax=Actinomadura sp. SCN-SB TaxID=3373092 RepID=UPI003752AEB5